MCPPPSHTTSGGTARLVAKYRPPMPILTLVVPRLVSDALHWKLEGRATARACQLTRGLLPMLATPGPNGDAVLEGAVLRAAAGGLVAPRGHVVVLQQIGEDYALKVGVVGWVGVGWCGRQRVVCGRACRTLTYPVVVCPGHHRTQTNHIQSSQSMPC